MMRMQKDMQLHKGKLPFGMKTTCDFWVSQKEYNKGMNNEMNCLVCYDLGTTWHSGYPTLTRESEETTLKLISTSAAVWRRVSSPCIRTTGLSS